jgi:apolipoprotein N-acyltransferase
LRNYKNGNLLTGAETYKLYNTLKTATASPTQQPGVFADSFSYRVKYRKWRQGAILP